MRMIGCAMIAIIALAAPATARDRTGFQAIAAGDFATAERTIEAERRIFPDRPELMLNLARVYRATGRPEQARALYGAVLDRPAVMMDLPNGDVASSHALANNALGAMAPAQIAGR